MLELKVTACTVLCHNVIVLLRDIFFFFFTLDLANTLPTIYRRSFALVPLDTVLSSCVHGVCCTLALKKHFFPMYKSYVEE